MVKLYETYPELIKSRYKLDMANKNDLNGKYNLDSEIRQGYSMLENAGKKRGCLVSGGNVDLNRIAAIVLDEFRGGKIGRITLEKPCILNVIDDRGGEIGGK
jgi:ribosome biogenesis GTPase A